MQAFHKSNKRCQSYIRSYPQIRQAANIAIAMSIWQNGPGETIHIRYGQLQSLGATMSRLVRTCSHGEAGRVVDIRFLVF